MATTIKRRKVAIIFLVFLVVLLILAFPMIKQTRIAIYIHENRIGIVRTITDQVSLISTIITPIKKTGIYTINVTIPKTGESFELKDIPDGEHVIVWRTYGIPEPGVYTIEVKLIRNDVIIDRVDLNFSF